MERDGELLTQNKRTTPKSRASKAKSSDVATSSSKKYRDLKEFLYKHSIKKNTVGIESIPITHTRIGGKENGETIHGGSYSIPDDEHDTFMSLYYQEVIVKGSDEFLTEKQLSNNGSIAIDIDLQFAVDIENRVYSKDNIEELLDLYLAELKNIYQFDDETDFDVYIFEKDSMNRLPSKQITKDGIHIIIGIQSTHETQCVLRNRIIKQIPEIWGDFPILNTWNDVFDERISNGNNNWQMFGSRKPDHKAYKLSTIYNVRFDSNDEQWSYTSKSAKISSEIFKKISIRNANHPQFFYKSSFTKYLEENSQVAGEIMTRKKTPSNNSFGDLTIYGDGDVRNIKNENDLHAAIDRFLESIAPSQYILRETYEYAMILPESFYGIGKGAYDKWIRVGWALKNTSERMLIVWIAFSAKASNFSYSSIGDLCDMWNKFKRDQNGVTERSIMYWAMQDANAEFKKVKETTVTFYLDQTINSITIDSINTDQKNAKGCGDYDIASVLYQLKKSQYKCTSVKQGIWYEFQGHRWVENDSGTSLRKSISDELRDLYLERASQMVHLLGNTDPDDEKTKLIRYKLGVITNICNRLARTNDKKNIMIEAKELFHDPKFMNLTDSNPYLLCFNNGVIDFKTKTFRKGLPEDYITKCTNIDYVPINCAQNKNIIGEIDDFMYKLFPKEDLRKYMWDHLASTLIGTASVNQTFNMYIGGGQNGKSVLTDLMSQILGNYKVAVPVALITQQRGKIGGLAPEIVAMKGARYAVMQEPTKGDRMNEGIMKELVSGMEPIKARAPYMIEAIEFIPQFKLVMCSNEFPEIKTQDHGTWRRIRVVPFESLFTETPVSDDPNKPYQFLLDRNIKEKFEVWKTVFASMLVDRVFTTNGLVADCPVVLSASNEYRERQDYLAEFVRDRVVKDPMGNVRKSQLTDEFKLWYVTNYGTRNPSPKDLHEYMDKMFGKNRAGVWRGARIKFRDDDDDDDRSVATTNDRSINDHDDILEEI